MQRFTENFRSEVFKKAHDLKDLYRWLGWAGVLKMVWKEYRDQKQQEREKEARKVATLTEANAQKIARNINAFDTLYQYIDGSKWFFWHDLSKKIHDILDNLKDTAKAQVKALCEPQQAKYFGL